MGIEQDIFINKHYAGQLVTQDTQNTNHSLTHEPATKLPGSKDQGQRLTITEEADPMDDNPEQATKKRQKNMHERQDSLDEKDKKLKDLQMNRLQGKLLYFIQIEKDLRAKIEKVTD